MINYRVSDLMALLDLLRSEGCNVDEKTDVSDFGKFGWVMEPEGIASSCGNHRPGRCRDRGRQPPVLNVSREPPLTLALSPRGEGDWAARASGG